MLRRICLAALGALSLWFSATAVIPSLGTAWMAPAAMAWLSMAVTLGLVVGTAASALLTLADALGARRLFVVSALGGAPWLLTVMALIWGFTIVADSAQFSTSVSELAPPEYIGTALSLQTCVGFLITLISTRLVPAMAATWGWAFAFVFLVPGPFLGTLAMWRLRRLPESRRLALGRR
jgi:MFS family permease